jgi:hypothetical protein
MPPLDPRRDFADDGGTPALRRRHAGFRIIDVEKPGIRGWWRRLTFAQQIALVLLLNLSGWILLAVTAIIGATLDAITQ